MECLVHRPEGARELVVESGGQIIVKAGGAITLLEGAAFNVSKGTPVNAAAASGTLTFTDAVADGELVVIGDSTYEFDTNSDVTEGHIAVDVSGGATAADAVAALLAAIAADELSEVSAAEGTGTAIVVTAAVKGAAANAIATTTTCANGTWGKDTLEGGVNGTEGLQGDMYVDESYLYVASADNSITDTNWRRISLGAAY